MYGSAIASPSDDMEVIKVPLVGEEDGEANQISRSMLVGIIRPRLEETFEIVRAKLDDAGFDKVATKRVVLTGGASQLTGVRQLASEVLGKQVRVGNPENITGLADAVNGPAFSACAGLIQFALNEREESSIAQLRSMEAPSSRLGRIGQWIREYI